MVTSTDKDLYSELIDTLHSIFGSHPGFRPVHAKGIMCEGTFQSSADARSLTRALHMQGASVPALVRFSNFSGVPFVHDNDAAASPHGMAIRFELHDGSRSDIVAHSYNGFPAKDTAEFLAFLKALAASSSDRFTLDRFLAEHPAAKRFAEDPKPAPQSFATQSYFAIDAFRFTNQEGRSRFGRFRIVPAAGDRRLRPDEAAKRWDNYLFEEIQERLDHHPAEFRLIVQLAGEGDPVEDPTRPWSEDRPQMELGKLSIMKKLPDSDTVQRHIAFDPAALPDGIEPGDPLIKVRSAAYALSLERRRT